MKKIFFLSLWLILFLTSCSNEERDVKKYFETTEVRHWSLSDTRQQIWYTASFDYVPLGAKVGGRIVSIHKEVGEKVQAGELLVSLDGAEARSGFASSQDIIRSLEQLKKTTLRSYEKQIEAAWEQIKQLETSLDLADIGISGADSGVRDTQDITASQIRAIESQIKQAELAYESAKLQYENTKNILEQKEEDISTNSKNAISAAIILWNNVIDFLDPIFGITDANKHRNTTFEIYLGAKDSWQKNEAENALRRFIDDFPELEKSAENISSEQEITETLEKFYNTFDSDMRQLLRGASRVFENSVTWVNLPEVQVQEWRQYINQLQTQNEQIILSVSGNYMLGLKGSLDNIASLEKEKKTQLDMLEKQVEQAAQQIEVLKENLAAQEALWSGMMTEAGTLLSSSEKQKELIYLQINEAEASISAIESQKLAALAEIDAQIAEVRAGRNEAGVMIDNANIRAPIDGIIVQKHAEVGQVIGAGMPILVVSNNRDIKIEISIGQNLEDMAAVWQEVNVKIEGISDLRSGRITKILPQRNLITKRTMLEISVPNPQWDIKLGSFARVFFEHENIDGDETYDSWEDTAEQNISFIIPNNAIISRYMIPWVYVVKDNIAHFTKIEILSQDESFSEVVWLQWGDVIITRGKENIFDGEKLN